MARKGQTMHRTVTYGLRQRAWWVIRKRGLFTLPELLSTLADGTERDAEGNLRKYLNVLALAGILKREDERKPGISPKSHGFYRYRLIINAGRKAPVFRAKDKAVFDPNSGIVYPMEAADA